MSWIDTDAEVLNGDGSPLSPIAMVRTCGLRVLTKRKHTVQLRVNGDTNMLVSQTTAAIMRRDAPNHQLRDGGNLYDPKGNKFVYDLDWSMDVFLNKASIFLGLIRDATRAFSSDGDEITNCLLFAEGSTIFVSFGEEFALEKSNHKNKVGHFTVGECMGKDRLGLDVYKGKFDLSGESAALKFIPKKALKKGSIKDRLHTEMTCLTKLKHPNIQNLVEVVDQPQHIVRIYDYSSTLSGGNIRHYLREQREGFALVWEQAQVVLLQIISAVTHLHISGVIHKDLTLDNICLITKGSLHQIKLTGFYVSEIVESLDQDLIAPLEGTLSYKPPEVFSNVGKENEPLRVKGPPMDIWALGVLFFALLSGRKPFSGPDLDCEHNYPPDVIQTNIVAGINQCTWDPRVSDTSKRIIKQLLARNPAKRPDVHQLYALIANRGEENDKEDDQTNDAEDGDSSPTADQHSDDWILGQTFTAPLKDESKESSIVGRRHSSVIMREKEREKGTEKEMGKGIQRTSPPPQTMLPEVPQLLVQEKKVSGAVINAFDAHINAIHDTLLTKLDTIERMTEESKKRERLASKPPRRKSNPMLSIGKIDLVPISEPDEDLLEMAEKVSARKFQARRISDFTGYSTGHSGDTSLSNSGHGLSTSLSGSLHGLSNAIEASGEGDGETTTVTSSTGSSHHFSRMRSMSVNDTTDSSQQGLGQEPRAGRKSEVDVVDGDMMENSTGTRLSEGTKTGIAMTMSTTITTSSTTSPLPMLLTPVVGGPPIRRNSSSSKDLASLGSLALVPIDTTTNHSRTPSPDLTAMMNSVANKLTFEEKSRPPNEEDIDYGESQGFGFKPIGQKTGTNRRGSKSKGSEIQGGGLPNITKPSARNKR